MRVNNSAKMPTDEAIKKFIDLGPHHTLTLQNDGYHPLAWYNDQKIIYNCNKKLEKKIMTAAV